MCAANDNAPASQASFSREALARLTTSSAWVSITIRHTSGSIHAGRCRQRWSERARLTPEMCFRLPRKQRSMRTRKGVRFCGRYARRRGRYGELARLNRLPIKPIRNMRHGTRGRTAVRAAMQLVQVRTQGCRHVACVRPQSLQATAAGILRGMVHCLLRNLVRPLCSAQMGLSRRRLQLGASPEFTYRHSLPLMDNSCPRKQGRCP